MSIWLILLYALAMAAFAVTNAIPDYSVGPLLAVALLVFVAGLLKTGIRRPVV